MWCVSLCNNDPQRLRQGAMQAAIQDAISKKQQHQPFLKLAKDEERLTALIKGNQGRLEHCFKKTPLHLRQLLQMDEEAGYSITDEVTADEMTQKVVSTFVTSQSDIDDLRILDLTACVGGNVLSFSKVFSNVIGIEIDEKRFQMLQHNVHVLPRANRNNTKAKVFLGNCVDILSGISHVLSSVRSLQNRLFASTSAVESDVFFLDPPWGGLNYSSHSKLDLFLSKTPLVDVVRMCLMKEQCLGVVVKVPYNANISRMEELVMEFQGKKRIEMLKWSMSKTIKCVVLKVIGGISSSSSSSSLSVSTLMEKTKEKKKKKKTKKKKNKKKKKKKRKADGDESDRDHKRSKTQ